MKEKLLVLLLWLSSVSLYAEDICIYRRYSQQDGLRDVNVSQITQDRYGRIWMATRGGITGFNGRRFNDYRGDGTYFYQISCDRYGRAWGTTMTGGCFRSTQDPNPPELEIPELDGQEVTYVFNPGESGTYFMNRSNEICRVLFDKNGTVAGAESLFSVGTNAVIYNMVEDEEGTLWTLTSNGLFRDKTQIRSEAVYCSDNSERGLVFGSENGTLLLLREGTLSRVQTPLHSNITLICVIPGEMGVLIGSVDEGLRYWTPERNEVREVRFNSYQSGPVRAFKDVNGQIWLYSTGGGLARYDVGSGTSVEFFDPQNQIGWNSESTLQTVFSDNQGHLWYSTSNGLIIKTTFYPDHFTLSPVAGSTSGEVSAENSTRAFLVDNEGHFIVTTRDNKAHLLNRQMQEVNSYRTGNPGYCLLQTHDGGIWIGTRGGGLIELSRGNGSRRFDVHTYTRNESEYYGINCRDIYYLCENSDHRLWIASLDGGISYVDLDNRRREFISKQNRLVFPTGDVNVLRHIAFGPNGWLYTCGALGLFISENPTDEPEEIRFRQVETLRNKDVRSVFFTEDGSMYACVSGMGLLCFDKRYDAGSYRSVSTSEGLLSEYILSAVEDHQGNLWIVSQAGLNRYNPGSGQVESFSNERIGQKLSFNEGLALCDNDGRIYVHTSSGILHFDPQEISGSGYAPRIAFTSLRRNGENVLLNGDALFAHPRDRIDMEFQAIDLGAAERIRYFYRIPERDKKWQELGFRPLLSLDITKIGNFDLELRSTNGDGVLTDNIRTIRIHSRLSTGGIIRNTAIALLLAGLVFAVVVFLRRRKNRETKEWRSEQDLKFIQDLNNYIDTHLDDGSLDVPEMSAALNMGRSAFYDWTKRLIGEAPSEYLRHRRLEKAKELLRLGGRSIYEIADMTGFNDSRYFSTTFRKNVGVTPSQYRKQFAGQDATSPKGDSE